MKAECLPKPSRNTGPASDSTISRVPPCTVEVPCTCSTVHTHWLSRLVSPVCDSRRCIAEPCGCRVCRGPAAGVHACGFLRHIWHYMWCCMDVAQWQLRHGAHAGRRNVIDLHNMVCVTVGRSSDRFHRSVRNGITRRARLLDASC